MYYNTVSTNSLFWLYLQTLTESDEISERLWYNSQ